MSYPALRILILLVAVLPLGLGAWCLWGPARARGGLRLPGLAGALGALALVLFAEDLSRGVAPGPLVLALLLVAVPIVACAWRPRIAVAIAVAWFASGLGLVWGRDVVYVGPRYDVVEASDALKADGEARVYVATGRRESLLLPLLVTQRAKDAYAVSVAVPLPAAAGPVSVRADALAVTVDGQRLDGATLRAALGWDAAGAGGVLRRRERVGSGETVSVPLELPRLGSTLTIAFQLAITADGVERREPVRIVLKARTVVERQWVRVRL